MELVDPHAHTHYSDGTDTPNELIVAAKNSGLDIVGVTDHDTFSGWSEALVSAERQGVGLIRGAEVSAQWEGRPVHILAFLPDPNYQPLLDVFENTANSRRTRLQKMTQNLQVDYPNLVWDNVEKGAAGSPLGRPHLADEMVRLGYFADRSEAFEWALHPRSPYWERQHTIGPVEAVELVRRAGGVPVFAHPRATKRGMSIPTEVVAQMVSAGLFGLERDHRDHSSKDREDVERWAKMFQLPLTGGSDYHGTGKPNRLGENTLNPTVLAQIEEQAITKVFRP